MVLDIGATNTGVMFVEKDRFFARSVPVAGNAITTEISRDLDIPMTAAEAIKIDGGHASERLERIVRNVFVRIHAEVNRSTNFYRSQQNGMAPEVILLTGGASQTPGVTEFFHKRCGVKTVDFVKSVVPVHNDLGLRRVIGCESSFASSLLGAVRAVEAQTGFIDLSTPSAEKLRCSLPVRIVNALTGRSTPSPNTSCENLPYAAGVPIGKDSPSKQVTTTEPPTTKANLVVDGGSLSGGDRKSES